MHAGLSVGYGRIPVVRRWAGSSSRAIAGRSPRLPGMLNTRRYAGLRDLAALPEARLSSGYVARPVGDEDVPGRVMAHRAAFTRRGSVWTATAPYGTPCRRGCIAGPGFGRGAGACTFTPDPQAMRNRDMLGGDLRSECGQSPGLVAVGRLDAQGAREDGDGAAREMDAVTVECHPHDAAPGQARGAPSRSPDPWHADVGRAEAGDGVRPVAHRSGFVQAFGNCGGGHFRSPEIHCDHVVEAAIHHEGSAAVRNLSVSVAMIVEYRM